MRSGTDRDLSRHGKKGKRKTEEESRVRISSRGESRLIVDRRLRPPRRRRRHRRRRRRRRLDGTPLVNSVSGTVGRVRVPARTKTQADTCSSARAFVDARAL